MMAAWKRTNTAVMRDNQKTVDKGLQKKKTGMLMVRRIEYQTFLCKRKNLKLSSSLLPYAFWTK